MKLHVIQTGTVGVSPLLPFGGDNVSTAKASGVFTKKKDRLWLPVFVYYIETPHGKILVDTGWRREMSPKGVFDRKAQIKELVTPMLYRINYGVVPLGQTADEQLAEMGVRPEDLDHVLISHLDCDHVCGLRAFKNAKNIMVSKKDLDHIRSERTGRVRFRPEWWEGVDLKTFDWNGTEGPVGCSYDVFGDGSVVMINIPGHSAGLCAIKVTGEDGRFVLIAADGGYARKSWEQMITSGISEDKELQKKSLAWIREQSENPDCIAVLASHDTEVTPHTIEF